MTVQLSLDAIPDEPDEWDAWIQWTRNPHNNPQLRKENDDDRRGDSRPADGQGRDAQRHAGHGRGDLEVLLGAKETGIQA